jgi:RNA polymerase sigma-54 factor
MYIATPSGVFELKYFMAGSVNNATTSGFSNKAVQYLIQEIINNEADALSDEEIVEALKMHAINVARRTVAKYRDALGIPTSSKRKRRKELIG